MSHESRRAELLSRCADAALACAMLCQDLGVAMRGAGRRERALLYRAQGNLWLRRVAAYRRAMAHVRGEMEWRAA